MGESDVEKERERVGSKGVRSSGGVRERVRGVGVGLSRFCSHSGHYGMFPTSSYYAVGWVLLCSVNKLLCLEFNDVNTEQSHRCVVVITSLIPRLLPPPPPSSLPSLHPPPLPFSGSSSPDLPLLPLIYPSPHSPLSRPRSIQSVLHHLP